MKKKILATMMVVVMGVVPTMSSYADTRSREHWNFETNADGKKELLFMEELTNTDDKDLEIVNALEEYEINTDGLVAREESLESDMNTIVYRDNEGELISYIFQEDVKYCDDNGNIQDKSNELKYEFDDSKYSTDYLCVNSQNNINTFFPKNLNYDTGVIVEGNDISIEITPNEETTLAEQGEDCVVYKGEDIEYEYQAMFEGYKENIIINDNSKNEFEFKVKAEDSELIAEDNAIYFVKDSDIVAVINPIYVYDSYVGDVKEGQVHYTYDNSMNFKYEGDDEYTITIVVDKKFLDNKNTVYPVCVDPSITIKSTGSGSSKSIIDTPIYNGTSVRNITAGVNVSGVIGYVDNKYNSGRMLMSFPGLANQAFMNSKYTIVSAKLTLNEDSGQTKKSTIGAYYYTGADWNEKSVYASNIWNGTGGKIGSATFAYPDSTKKNINMLSAVKKWQTDKTSEKKGIILKNDTSENNNVYYKCINTSESGNKPYLTVKYFYNGVRGVRTLTTEYLNCQCYAFFLNEADSFPEFSASDYRSAINSTISDALTLTKKRMKEWLNRRFGSDCWREVEAYSSDISSNEWLVCMRVGMKDTDNNGVKEFDYHFWYRAQNGRWYNKHGWYQPSECVSGVVNPSTANNCSGWNLANNVNFYSSQTIYYAIKKR